MQEQQPTSQLLSYILFTECPGALAYLFEESIKKFFLENKRQEPALRPTARTVFRCLPAALLFIRCSSLLLSLDSRRPTPFHGFPCIPRPSPRLPLLSFALGTVLRRRHVSLYWASESRYSKIKKELICVGISHHLFVVPLITPSVLPSLSFILFFFFAYLRVESSLLKNHSRLAAKAFCLLFLSSSQTVPTHSLSSYRASLFLNFLRVVTTVRRFLARID